MDNKYIIGIIALILLVAIAAFALTGSGDDGVVSIGYQPSDHDSALFVANATKMFEEAGIKVELHEFNNGGDLTNAMASGEVDVGYIGVTPAFSAISKGIPIKIVAGAQKEGSALVSHSEDITSISDLKGKTIATSGDASIQHLLLQYDLQKHNLSLSDVNSPGMKLAAMSDALKTGSIDAMVTPEPYASNAVSNGEHLVYSTGEIVEGHPCCVVVMTDKFLNDHNDEAKKVIDIHNKATQFIIDNPKEAVQYIPANVMLNQTVEEGILSNMTWVVGLNDTYKQDIRDFAQLERDIGVLDQDLTDEQLFYNG